MKKTRILAFLCLLMIATSSLFAQARHPYRIRQQAPDPSAIGGYPTLGSPRALIMLVEYEDCRFTFGHDEFEAMINEPGYSRHGGTGSALDYFRSCSGGLFTPQFDVVGPITLPHKRVYYGMASGNTYDTQPWLMLTDAAPMVDNEVDFSLYDTDADGFVDNVFIFYAGMGQNDGGPFEAVWPHAANIYTYYNLNVTLDGVRLGAYACTNELTGASTPEQPVLTGIGTFCHEFSHVLGLPDFYSTTNTTCFSPGAFELMDRGSYNNQGRTPPYLSAYSRATLGWLNPRVLTAPETVVLPVGEALRINCPKEGEYYLLENRQQTGWDTYLPAHGMLIWHIDHDADAWQYNQVNILPQHQRIDLVEADGILTTATCDGDAFPGRNNVTAFTPTSWTGIPMDAAITDIREQNGLITFKYRGGGDRLPAPVSLAATDVTPTGFIAHWQAEPTAASYEVDVFAEPQVVPCAQYTSRQTEVCISGLTPATQYRYVVRAVDGELRSPDSEPQCVTTLPPSFDMLAPTSLPASEVSATGFTAHWEPMPEATAYELTLYATHLSAPNALTLDFTGGISALPTGWTTTCTSTDSRSSYCGASAPSLRMVQDGDYLQSPQLEGQIIDVEFWQHQSNAEGTVTVSTEGGHVRFTHHGTQIAYIDDIRILYGGEAVPDTLMQIAPLTANSYPFAELRPATTYHYTLRGINADGVKSQPSASQSVTTLDAGEGITPIYLQKKQESADIRLTPVILETYPLKRLKR